MASKDLNILMNTGLENTKIELFDISGRSVYDMDLGYISERISIPVDLNSGMYIVYLSSNQGVFTAKVIIE